MYISLSYMAAFLLHHYKNKSSQMIITETYIAILLLINFADIMMIGQFNQF